MSFVACRHSKRGGAAVVGAVGATNAALVTRVSPYSTPLIAPFGCASVMDGFPETLPLVKSQEHKMFHYDASSNGPHEHESHAPTRGIAHLLTRAPRGLWGRRTDLWSLPSTFNCLPLRHYASKFTVTDSRDPIFTPPDFSSVERASNSPEANRAFSYFMVGATGVLGAMSAKSTVMNFLSSWSASSEALAMAQVEVDLSAIPEGKSVVIKWRGKPIFIRHRTPAEIEEAEGVELAELRDPQRDADRTQRPEWIVMLGICTHLGCVPLANSGDYNGWYCPCQ